MWHRVSMTHLSKIGIPCKALNRPLFLDSSSSAALAMTARCQSHDRGGTSSTHAGAWEQAVVRLAIPCRECCLRQYVLLCVSSRIGSEGIRLAYILLGEAHTRGDAIVQSLDEVLDVTSNEIERERGVLLGHIVKLKKFVTVWNQPSGNGRSFPVASPV